MGIVNPVLLVVGVLQVAAGVYAAATSDYKLAVINVCVGVANSILATLKGA
jgi:hypothetical protein